MKKELKKGVEFLAHGLDTLTLAGWPRWRAVSQLAQVVLDQQKAIDDLTERVKKLEKNPPPHHHRKRLY